MWMEQDRPLCPLGAGSLFAGWSLALASSDGQEELAVTGKGFVLPFTPSICAAESAPKAGRLKQGSHLTTCPQDPGEAIPRAAAG